VTELTTATTIQPVLSEAPQRDVVKLGKVPTPTADAPPAPPPEPTREEKEKTKKKQCVP
jgi:hypothetical protein